MSKLQTPWLNRPVDTHRLSATVAWRRLLNQLLAEGDEVAPRGEPTLELPQQTLCLDMRHPVLVDPNRRLSYPFMAAEAYWILTGDNKVETIAPYNKNIAKFSDDGLVFAGAYGPPIRQQLPYVLDTLRRDPASRQAGLTIWRPAPAPSKDIPCTVAIFATIRDQELRLNVFMRSSDAWLGVPYDIFNFSMLGHLICAELNTGKVAGDYIAPGELYLTMASSHLYEINVEGARRCLELAKNVCPPATPVRLFLSSEALLTTLRELRESGPGSWLRWWETTL